MKTITITEEQVKQYKLPAKAVGDWSIVEKAMDTVSYTV